MTRYYQVLWPDGDVYISRSGETDFTIARACAIAQCIGGTVAQETGQTS